MCKRGRLAQPSFPCSAVDGGQEADGAVAAAAGDAEQPAQSDAVVAAPDAAAAAEPAVANGSDNPGHAGVPEGEAQAAHAVAGNPGQAAHPEHTGARCLCQLHQLLS